MEKRSTIGRKTVKQRFSNAPAARRTQFQPGNPGGPGRPKRSPAIERALKAIGEALPHAVDVLVSMLDREDEPGLQVRAAETLIERVLGRPKQSVEVAGEGGGPVRVDLTLLSDAALTEYGRALAIARERAVAVNGNGNGTPKPMRP